MAVFAYGGRNPSQEAFIYLNLQFVFRHCNQWLENFDLLLKKRKLNLIKLLIFFPYWNLWFKLWSKKAVFLRQNYDCGGRPLEGLANFLHIWQCEPLFQSQTFCFIKDFSSLEAWRHNVCRNWWFLLMITTNVIQPWNDYICPQTSWMFPL